MPPVFRQWLKSFLRESLERNLMGAAMDTSVHTLQLALCLLVEVAQIEKAAARDEALLDIAYKPLHLPLGLRASNTA